MSSIGGYMSNDIKRSYQVESVSGIIVFKDLKTKCLIDVTDDRIVSENINIGDLFDQYLVEDTHGDRHTFFAKHIDFHNDGVRIEPKTMKLLGHRDALHQLGYIGRPDSKEIEYIHINSEKDDYLIGNFVEGLGFINVHFPKHQCHDLTQVEKDIIDRSRLVIV